MTATRTTPLAGLLLLASLLAGVLPPGTAEAQESKDGPAQERSLLVQVRALEMDSLQRGRVTVHFSPGYRDRAERLAPRVGRELQLFADSLGARLGSFHLILPGPAHWKQLAEEQPYGVPKSLGAWQRDNMPPEQAKSTPLRPPAALVPADAKGAAYEQLLPLKECAPTKYRERLEEAGFSWKEAARRYVEAITFHEVAHLITDTDAYQVGMPLWFREFLANVFGYAYMHHGEPTYAAVWDVMTAVTLECQRPSHGRTLPKAERLGQGAGDYHWFQSFLIQRANRVVEAHGFDFLRAAPKAFPPRSSASSDPLWDKIDALEQHWNQLSDEEALRRLREINDEMLRRLEQIAPGFHKWAKRFQRDEGDGG